MFLGKKSNYTLFGFVSQVNSSLRKKSQYVDVLPSKLIINILVLLVEHGCISEFRYIEGYKKIRIFFKYYGGKPVVGSLKAVSKPSKKVYWTVESVFRYSKNKGLAGFYIISTSKGLYVNQDLYMLKRPISGEVLLYIKI